MTSDCPFCILPPDRLVDHDELTLTILDAFPVSPGHSLIIPRRHVASLFDVTLQEWSAMKAAIDRARARLDAEHQPDGYNVGVNVGEAAGQSVMHVHVHLIPRFKRDVTRPRGGVRHVVPKKGYYP